MKKEISKYVGVGVFFWWALPAFIMIALPIAAYQLMFKDRHPKHVSPDLRWQIQQWFKESSADKQWREENL